MSEGRLEELVRFAREGLVANTEMSEQEKERTLDFLMNLKFEDGRYIEYYLNTFQPTLSKNLNLKFEFHVLGKSSITNSFLLTIVTERPDAIIKSRAKWWSYRWILNLDPPFTKANVEGNPGILRATFPTSEVVEIEVQPF